MILNFSFTLEQANVILKGLESVPYGIAVGIINEIQRQATPQLSGSKAAGTNPEKEVNGTGPESSN